MASRCCPSRCHYMMLNPRRILSYTNRRLPLKIPYEQRVLPPVMRAWPGHPDAAASSAITRRIPRVPSTYEERSQRAGCTSGWWCSAAVHKRVDTVAQREGTVGFSPPAAQAAGSTGGRVGGRLCKRLTKKPSATPPAGRNPPHALRHPRRQHGVAGRLRRRTDRIRPHRAAVVFDEGSALCLPPPMGSGLRLVYPDAADEHRPTRLVNSEDHPNRLYAPDAHLETFRVSSLTGFAELRRRSLEFFDDPAQRSHGLQFSTYPLGFGHHRPQLFGRRSRRGDAVSRVAHSRSRYFRSYSSRMDWIDSPSGAFIRSSCSFAVKGTYGSCSRTRAFTEDL